MPESASGSSREIVARRGIRLGRRTIRQHAARGTIVNAGFSIGLALITLLRGVVIARFLTRADYGIWGILVASVATLFSLKQVGVADKYIQQEGEDQELAFQHAFSVECILNGAFVLLLLVAVPGIAALYGRSELILPGLSLALLLPAYTLQAPVWIFYRQMRFTEQRLIQAADPIIGAVIAIALAVAGLGYWSLIIGVIAGGWAAALLALRASPYRLRFRITRPVLRSYVSFSWPLFVVSFSALVLVQVSLFFGTRVTGLAGAGAITLAANVSQFSERADEIVSGTMYPLVCAVQHRLDLLYESFVKSNRLALVWAMPFGLGLSLFASALVHYGLGSRWHEAIPLDGLGGCDHRHQLPGDRDPVHLPMGVDRIRDRHRHPDPGQCRLSDVLPAPTIRRVRHAAPRCSRLGADAPGGGRGTGHSGLPIRTHEPR
jgi:O-antigen/teichoic acid export membrane protein